MQYFLECPTVLSFCMSSAISPINWHSDGSSDNFYPAYCNKIYIPYSLYDFQHKQCSDSISTLFLLSRRNNKPVFRFGDELNSNWLLQKSFPRANIQFNAGKILVTLSMYTVRERIYIAYKKDYLALFFCSIITLCLFFCLLYCHAL